MSKLGRNAPCPCGSGKKYKRCCEVRNRVAGAASRQSRADAQDPHFTVEISPEVEQQTDRLLAGLQRGERGGIREQFLALAKQHPLQHLPQFGLGVYELVANNDPAAALPFFERAVDIYPYFSEAHYNLAGCATKQGDIRKAVQSLRKVISYTDDPDIANRARDKLKTLELLVTKDGKFATLEDYVTNQALFEQAFDALSRREFERAADGFRKVLEQDPAHVQSYGNLALALAGLGRKAAALECLDKALALDPNYAPARFNRRAVETMEEGRGLRMPMAETKFYLEQAKSERQSGGLTLG